MCDPSIDYPLQMKSAIKNDGDKQYLTGSGDFKVDFGADSDVGDNHFE